MTAIFRLQAIDEVDGLPLEIDAVSGVVTISADTDFELGSVGFEFVIVAADQGDPALEAALSLTLTVLDINDNAPEIAEVNSTTTVLRDTAVGTLVFVFEDVTDADTGVNAETRFRLLQQSFQGMFALNATSGSVVLSAALCEDHQATQSASLIAQIHDLGTPRLASDANLVISFENAPAGLEFADAEGVVSTFTEVVPAGTVLANFTAVHNNSCYTDAAIAYSIVAGNSDSAFAIDTETGVVTVTALADFTGPDQIAVTVQAAVDVEHIDAVTTTVTFAVVGSAYDGGKFRTSGAGLMVGSPTNGANSSFAQTFGLVAQQGAEGTMEASFGLLTAVQEFDGPPRNPAANFTAHVFQTEMWAHDSQVRAVVQVADAYGQNAVAGTTVSVRLVPNGFLQQVSTDFTTVRSCTVPANTIDGTCFVHFPAVPAAYFTDTSLTESEYPITVEAAIPGLAYRTIGTVSLRRSRSRVAGSHPNDVVLELPEAPFHPGQLFTATAWASTRHTATTFTLLLHPGSGILIGNSITADDETWSVTMTQNISLTVVTGRLQANVQLTRDVVTAPQVLFSISMSVDPDASTGTNGTVGMQVELLTQHILGRVSIRGESRSSGDPAPNGTVTDVRAAASQTGGLVGIVADPVEHIILSVPTTELVNYGVLTAATQSVRLRVHTCTACGRLAGSAKICVAQCIVATSAATCSTSDASVLGVDGCSAVLDGTETGSSASVTITVALGAFELQRAFQVWRPVLPLTLSVGRITLHKIRNYFNASNCNQALYQSAELRINTSFHAGSDRQVSNIDLSHLLRDQIVVESEFERGTVSTAVLSNSDGFLPVITGAAAGQGRIFVRKGTVNLGTMGSTLTVSDSPVDITDLEVYPASILEMSTVADGNATRTHAERYPVSAVPKLNLFIEGHEVR